MPTTSKSSTITDVVRRRVASRADALLPPVHPGEVLDQEFLIPMGLSANRVASEIGIPAPRINDIVLRRRAITAETALLLAQYFGISAKFWLGLQADYDLDVERDRLGETLNRIVRVDLTKPHVTRGRKRIANMKRGVAPARRIAAKTAPKKK